MKYADESVGPPPSVPTPKKPLAHVQPLFYMTWVMKQVMTSWEACMHSMMSLTILAGIAVHMHCTGQFPGHWACCLPHSPYTRKLSLPGAPTFYRSYEELYFVHRDIYRLYPLAKVKVGPPLPLTQLLAVNQFLLECPLTCEGHDLHGQIALY